MLRSSIIYEITITDFNTKYPRTKKSFKHTLIANNFGEEMRINMVSVSARWLYLKLVLIANDCNKSVICMSEERLKKTLSVRYDIHKCVSELESIQLLTVKKTSLIKERKKELKSIEENAAEVAKEKKEVLGTKVPGLAKENFKEKIEELYTKHYPLKKGKTPGLKTLTKEIKTNEDLMLLKKAIMRYEDEIKKSGQTKIKYFSTFANQWKDFLDENYGDQTNPEDFWSQVAPSV